MKRIWRGLINPRTSLRAQLIITITGVHMILMISFITDLMEKQHRLFAERGHERGATQARILASAAVPQLITRDLAGLQEIVDSLALDSSIRSALLTDESGRVLAHSDRAQVGLFLQDKHMREVAAGPAKPVTVAESGASIVSASPVLAEGRRLGWVWITTDMTTDFRQLLAVRRSGIIYMVIAVLSGAAFAILLATAITRQLRLLLSGTRRLAEDRLDEPVPVVTANEVGFVARAFNDAMLKLSAERAQVTRTRTALEEEVRERRRAEENLKAANQAISSANESLKQFAYAASHDLQEPLRSVAGYSDLLKKRYSGKLDEDATEFIEYIHSGATRMQKLLRALLDYSKAGASGDPAAAVDCNRAVASALENLDLAIETSSAVIDVEPLPKVFADEVAVVQLFQNLIGNAIKYAGEKPPHIRIFGEVCEDYCRIAVKDSGIGIAPRDKERIFGIFKRVHGSTYPGTGIGLAICSKIVERYGGRIWVESEPGEGSTFSFTLPAIPRRNMPAGQAVADSALAGGNVK